MLQIICQRLSGFLLHYLQPVFRLFGAYLRTK
jgi:hypothetical protein